MSGSPETTLVELFEGAGFPRAHAALLHPADVFVDLSGEDIRRRLYLTQDADGAELCLRPEFTIPLCVDLVRTGKAASAALSYYGPVFRHRQGESGEFIQAGIESLGRTDQAAADAEMLALALASARSLGLADPTLTLSDAGLLNSLLGALGATPAYARRLKRRLAAGKPAFADSDEHATAGLDRYAGVMAALEGAGPKAARAFVTDMLSMSGVQVSGGRTVEEIAERFLEKAQNGDKDLPQEKRQVLKRFLAIKGNPDDMSLALRQLADDASIDMIAAVDAYDTRTGFMAARGIAIQNVRSSTNFVRNLDYYTGLMFEISDPAFARGKPLVGGGRYDGLLARLGAAQDVPAVGFSIWVERFGTRDHGGAA